MKLSTKHLIFAIFSIMFFSCSINTLGTNLEYSTNHTFEGEISPQKIVIENDIETTVNEEIGIPTRLNASSGQFNDRIILEWKNVYYKGYKALYYIYFSEDGLSYKLFNNEAINENSYTFLSAKSQLEAGKRYHFAVRSYIAHYDLVSLISEVVIGWTIGKPNRFVASFRENVDVVNLTWPAVDDAAYYTIKRAEVAAGEPAPTALGSYEQVGNPIPASQMLEDETFLYQDKSAGLGGTLISQSEYWYILYSHTVDSIVSNPSNPVRGALLAIGVPGPPTMLNITKGLLDNTVRIMWKGIDDRKNYVLYRITRTDLENGISSGTQMNINIDEIKEDPTGTYFYYYDKGVSFANGEQYFYRVAAKNDLGIGLLSDFDIDDPESIEFSMGYGFEKYDNREISVRVTSKGFVAEWDKVLAADSYYVYRFIATEDKKAPQGDSDWSFLKETTENSILDDDSAFNFEKDEVYYRVFPVKLVDSQPLVKESDWTFSLPDELLSLNYFVSDSSETTPIVLSIQTLVDELEALSLTDTTRIGHAGISASDSDFTVEVPQFSVNPVASQNDKNIKGKIRLTGRISDISGFEKLNVKLIRTCYYGDEDGVYPLAEPRKAIGGVSFTKKGLPHVAAVEVFDLKPYIDSRGEISFIDPMHDFRNGEVLEGRTLIWDYGTWDREAWKDIKRQKMFDMERAVKVHYQVRIERSGDSEWKPTVSPEFQGWPCLTDIEFAHLANWMKDVALNRLSSILIPRYAWNKTLAWLLSSNQRVDGENSPGKAAHLRTWADGLGGAGSGGVEAGYSDWKGFTFKTDQDITLAVSLDSNKERNIEFKFSFVTPLYSGSADVSIYVRDYNYHWGLWSTTKGHYKVLHSGVNSDWVSFQPDLLIPVNGSVIVNSPNSLRYGLALGREAYDAGGEPFPLVPGNDAESCTFTRINFKYRPVPVNSDLTKEQYPHMVYGYID